MHGSDMRDSGGCGVSSRSGLRNEAQQLANIILARGDAGSNDRGRKPPFFPFDVDSSGATLRRLMLKARPAVVISREMRIIIPAPSAWRASATSARTGCVRRPFVAAMPTHAPASHEDALSSGRLVPVFA